MLWFIKAWRMPYREGYTQASNFRKELIRATEYCCICAYLKEISVLHAANLTKYKCDLKHHFLLLITPPSFFHVFNSYMEFKLASLTKKHQIGASLKQRFFPSFTKDSKSYMVKYLKQYEAVAGQ